MKYLEQPRHDRRRWRARSGASWATARWTSRSRWARSPSAAREKLDNLIFVINCNLQRLDGPVRGNSKHHPGTRSGISAAPDGTSSRCCGVPTGIRCSARDTLGLLRKRMEECVDGEYQAFKSKGGAFTREHFFGKYPELKDMVDRPERLRHLASSTAAVTTPQKVYAAYAAAVKHKGQPTVILAKTVKGYGMGEAGEGQQHHAPAEENWAKRRSRRSAIASRFRSPTTRSRKPPSTGRRTTAPRSKYIARAAQGAGRLSSRSGEPRPSRCTVPELERLRRSAEVERRPRVLDHHGLRAACSTTLAAGQGDRQARGADRRRRGADLRHGRPVPPARHLLLGRAALSTRRMPSN